MIAPAFGVLFDGFAYGMLLFLLSVGLSVTLGMMNFVNLAHGSFAMLGAYVAVTLMRAGMAVLRHLALSHSLLPPWSAWHSNARCSGGFIVQAISHQVLLTLGLAFISVAAAAWFYGTMQQPVRLPAYLRSYATFMGVNFSIYRLFLIAVALAITVLLVATLEYTRFGAQVRAAVDNQRMAQGLGIDVDGVFAITFALGSGLAGLGGALAIEIVGLDPNFAFTYLIYVLIVVAVGGLGSIRGSLLAAIVLGVSDAAGKYYVPTLGAFLIYLVMVGLLLWRPSGLFGTR